MDINTNIKKELLDDEVIQYIAHRHHVTADDVVDSVIVLPLHPGIKLGYLVNGC